MATDFSRTLRSLDKDRSTRLVLPALIVVAAWALWMGLARVPVYETTRSARIEVARAAFPIASLVSGRVATVDLKLGDNVTQGQTLVKLDATAIELEMGQAQARVTAARDRRDAVQREIAAEKTTLDAIRQARDKGVAELQARIAQNEAQLELSRQHALRLRKLVTSNAVSAAELEQAEASLKASDAAVAESKASLDRIRLDRLTLESECSTRIVRLERESVDLDGGLKIEMATIARLEQAIRDHTILAPVDGRIDDLNQLRVGSVVTAAQKIAVIVPAGQPRAVAGFPVVAVGRIRKGQFARMRMDGFPWTQYGTVGARVTEVGTEPEEGMIRVELSLQTDQAASVPIEHGLTGSIEIEVERTSPTILALRAAGQYLGTRRDF